MSVRVTPLNALGVGVPLVTQFADTFNRASGNLGQNWLQTISPFTPIANPITTSTFTIGAGADLAQCVIMSVVGTANPGMTYPCGLLAMPIYMSNFGRSQFSEWKLISLTRSAGNDIICGPALLLQNSGGLSVGSEQTGLFGYQFHIATDLASYAVRRGNGNVFTTLRAVAAGPFVSGDVFRLEARINVADVTLKAFVNNVQQGADIVDNSGGRLITGSPGWIAIINQGNSAGEVQTCQWRNFRGGLL